VKTALKLALLIVGVGIFAALVWQAGPAEVWSQLRGFGWKLLLFLLPSILMYLVDALAWRTCFREPPPMGFLRLFLVRMAGESLNNTLPSAYMGGEPIKALLLQREGISGAEGMASVIVAKTAMTVAQILFVLTGIACAGLATQAEGNLPALITGSLLCAVFAMAAMALAYAGQRYGLGRMLLGFSGRTGLLRDWIESQREGLERMDETLGAFYRHDQRRFWISAGLFFLGWSCEVAEVAVFAWLLGIPLGLSALIAIGALATVVKAAGFFLPGSLGAQEGGNVLLFLGFGLTHVSAITFSILRRFRELCWIGFGFSVLAVLGWPAAEASVSVSAAE
jgi:uncharacterized protein (TIRG00374 family)